MAVKTAGDRSIEAQIGADVRALRLGQNLDQKTVASRAHVSLGALKNLESGAGSTLTTLARVLGALGRLDVLTSIDSRASSKPRARDELGAHSRKRASRPRTAPMNA